MNFFVLWLILGVAVFVIFVRLLTPTYTLTIEQFKGLFKGMNDNLLVDATAVGPNHAMFTYKIYPIDVIECYNKKDNLVVIKNSPALEIQFTDNNNKRTGFYFDLLRVNGNIITGGDSRYLSNRIKTIELNTVIKIELRKMKKGFKYTKNPFT
jgi:hypothetical protein